MEKERATLLARIGMCNALILEHRKRISDCLVSTGLENNVGIDAGNVPVAPSQLRSIELTMNPLSLVYHAISDSEDRPGTSMVGLTEHAMIYDSGQGLSHVVEMHADEKKGLVVFKRLDGKFVEMTQNLGVEDAIWKVKSAFE